MLAEALQELGIDQPVHVINVLDDEDARGKRSLGSPTIRINGLDVDPLARESTDFAMKCRIYRVGDGIQGYPSKDMVVAALKDAGELV
ncbi:MAG TPA: DUF2703 domain-containing protein [Actinobacteria bacterium]|nr:DUF2703 domain-containing protein [Actinomycetota bacterium]